MPEAERWVGDTHVGTGSHGDLGLWDVKCWTQPALALPTGTSQSRAPGWGPRGRLPLGLPPPAPSEPPAVLANRTRCCFGENTFWSWLAEPSQPTPTVEKMCQDKWEISAKYLKKGKREKKKKD